MKRNELVAYLDTYLRVKEITDNSQNGLQVQGAEDVKKVAVAVDACQQAIDKAVEDNAQLLLVHHGLIWEHPFRVVGSRYSYVKKLIEGNCGLYGVHLPLDLHPEVGNNAEMVRLLGLQNVKPFGTYMGIHIGFSGELQPAITLSELAARLEQILGMKLLKVQAYGPDKPKRVAVITGLGIPMVDQVESTGCDTYITGETGHNYFHEAADRGLNVLYGGHYGTETLGVKAVAHHLQEKFGLKTVFLDVPTGI
jgi:dinuclear metal center YbgI/SA1388 family protein